MTVLRGWLPVVCWAGVISLLSSGAFSGDHTSSVLLPILSALFPGAHPHDLERAHAVIRKLAHVVEYMILGGLTLRALRLQGVSLVRAMATAIVLGALFAASDELHQAFVPSRTAAFGDVLIDTAGVAGGVVLWRLAREPRRRSLGAARLDGA
ncbi:MAG TPA: VanZ family protein [Candidatus Binatia bacterium]|nr:VanZ family protein [Candidatus Binatia bacterium]